MLLSQPQEYQTNFQVQKEDISSQSTIVSQNDNAYSLKFNFENLSINEKIDNEFDIEDRINSWLDNQQIMIATPSQKMQEFYNEQQQTLNIDQQVSPQNIKQEQQQQLNNNCQQNFTY